MRLGGYVIHGNNVSTLDQALRSLTAICDVVVAVDSCSTDGSAELVKQFGCRHIVLPWQGFGAARKAATEALVREGVDWILFLDSDEWLSENAVNQIARWKQHSPGEHWAFRLPRHDHVLIGDGRRFRFRTEQRKRLVRADKAIWTESMVVHEALPGRRGVGELDAAIEHRFHDGSLSRRDRLNRYALLWAVQAHVEGRRPKNPFLSGAVHWFRNAIVKGALLRGGLLAARLSVDVARYHSLKYRYLAQIRAGLHRELVDAYKGGQFGRLFELVS